MNRLEWMVNDVTPEHQIIVDDAQTKLLKFQQRILELTIKHLGSVEKREHYQEVLDLVNRMLKQLDELYDRK
jgi:hypothetical protein